jgi:hypothetical protein
MRSCYCCGRSEDEVRDELLRIADEEYAAEDKFVRMEMEEEDKKVLDLQREWENLRQKASDNLAGIFSVDVFSLLKGGASSQGGAIDSFLKNAEKALGSAVSGLDPDSVEREIREKIEMIKNLNDYNGRMTAARERHERLRDSILREKEWLTTTTIKLGENALTAPICRVCASR